jgi:pSer/pThr/pTyr-binding forkhead associated (FHA) protein
LELAGPSVVVGRSHAAQVRLPGTDVSGAHARLQWADGGLRVEDLGSVNGTRAGERSLAPGRTYPLAWGEPLCIADYVLTVLDPAAESAVALSGEAGTATLAAHLVRDMAGGRDAARLHVRDRAGHERRVPLAPGQRLRLGRGPGCEVRLADPDLSREHAEVCMAAEGATLRDLGSKNGVTVNGAPWTETGPLRHGDVIRLGSCEARYEDPAEALLAELNRPRDEDAPVDDPDLGTGTGIGTGLADDPPAPSPALPELEPAPRPPPSPGRLGRTLLIVLGLTLMGAAVYLLLWLFA